MPQNGSCAFTGAIATFRAGGLCGRGRPSPLALPPVTRLRRPSHIAVPVVAASTRGVQRKSSGAAKSARAQTTKETTVTSHKIQHCQTFEWAIARGWRLLPCYPPGHPRGADGKTAIGKLVPHAAHSATTDRNLIAQWLAEWPDANWAVACGAPGPQVLDIDNAALVPRALAPSFRSAPRVRTGRGGHVYFRGTQAATVVLDFGELRGVGSYAAIPPSVHPSGARYRWIAEPHGPLPHLPVSLARTESRKHGGGEQAVVSLVPYGKRHDHLIDLAVRLARSGVLDIRRVEVHLQCEFDHFCEPLPSPKPGALAAIARWAVNSRIAERERARNGH